MAAEDRNPPSTPRTLCVESWEEVRRLAAEWISRGAARQAFRLVLAHRLPEPTPESAAFMRENFREVPLRLVVAMVQGIGNMVMLTPALEALKQLYPRCEIEVVGHHPALQVVEGTSPVARCTPLEEFDPARDRDAALLSIWSGQFQKAYGESLARDGLPVPEVKFVDHERHETEYHMDLARLLGCQGPPPEPFCAAREAELPFDPEAPVALLADTSHPDEEWQKKRWPFWPQLAERLLERGFTVGLVGGPREAEQFDSSRWPREILNLTGRYSVPETAYVIREAGLLIANDSGPAHLGGAVGARTCVLFGPTLEAKNLPGGPRVEMLAAEIGCRPCQYLASWQSCRRHRCMELLGVDRVLAELLGQTEPAPADHQPAPPSPAEQPPRVQVDLGCGRYKRRGYIGIDVDPDCGADIVCDVTEGIPLETDSVDYLVADNLLEHIGEGLKDLINEIWRVCKPTATVEITVPLFPGEKAVADPTHRRYFTEETFCYLDAREGKWQVFGSSYGFKPFHVLRKSKLAGELEVLLRPCKEQVGWPGARPPRTTAEPRVCFVSHNQPGAGGGENAMHQVANGLCEQGFQVTAIYNATPFIHSIPVEEPADALYRVRWVEGADLESFHHEATRAVAARSDEFDVCMPLWRASSPELMRACERSRLAAGLWCQNVQYAPERTNDSVFRLADYVVTVTPFGKLMLEQRFDRTEEVYVIPNACSGRFFEAYADRRDERMERFVFFGRLADQQKGLGTLCNALSLLSRQRQDWRLDVIGDGPDADRMRSRVGTLELGEQVRFLGWKKPAELAPLLATYDLCLLPSNFEGCSLALIEAMAAGVPVITTKVGGNPCLISDKKHGRIIPPARPKLLAETILWACEHPAAMRLMARFAHKKALKRYHWGRVVGDYCKLFSKIELPARAASAARKAG